jgi:predicted ABC-class ATPase
VVIKGDTIVIRLLAGLPAFGRRIAGDHALEMFFEELPAVVRDALFWKRLDHSYFFVFVDLMQKQEKIRSQLRERGLISFIADDAVLPRSSGIEDTPLSDAVPFRAPETLRTSFSFEDGTTITGMGIKRGITIITGGGFHGKSTLLNAIQAGIYNHIPGDGREYAVSIPEIVKIRAEDGRNIEKVDISTFIKNLPQGRDTVEFVTPNASGSTSQAANIMEALEVGTEALIMDEDTCATNFLIRDKRMQELIPAEKEPITPYIDVAPELYEQAGVSTIFVVGGSGDYIDIADTVIMLDHFRVFDVTDTAKDIARQFPYAHVNAFSDSVRITPRFPKAASIDPRKGKKDANIKTREQKIVFGRNDIDLGQWEHIVERTQLDTIGDILLYGVRTGLFKERMTVDQFIEAVTGDIEENGLDTIFEKSGRKWTYYSQVRKVDVAAALNRLRTLQVHQ